VRFSGETFGCSVAYSCDFSRKDPQKMNTSVFNKNNVKTVVLLSSLAGALVVFGGAFGGRTGASIGLMIGLVMVGGSYWFSDRLAVRAAGAVELPDGELPTLRADLEAMSSRAGIIIPRLFVSPSMQPNAFATGRNEKHAVVCVTQGLLQVLDRNEVNGVVAHELGHIKHRDILIGSIAAAIATGITYMAQMAMFAGMFGGDDEDRPNPLAMLLMMLLAPLAASLIQASLSRSREFEADRAGAEISGNPQYLANALQKIEAYAKRVPMDINPAQASAYIVNPLTGRKVQFARLFMTHPPTEDRIAALLGESSHAGIS
jgi:heat shock protein HtpX